MSQKRYPVKAFIRISKKISRKFFQTTKKQLIWLLRTVFGVNRKTESANAGFVLPTVVMVSIVVVLLTIAIMFRSFDRAKNASNVRVNQAVLTASTPALDRARAKLKKLFDDKRLPRSTPSDKALDGVLKDQIKEYTFGDETLLQLSHPDSAEPLQTAWRFPVDTDNNGKFDSYTLYGIYYKNPELNNNKTQYKTQRNPLQARATPMTFASIGSSCANAGDTSASLVGVNGWFQSTKSLRLVKAFFVYTATVPITDETKLPDQTNYEVSTGNRGFSALEYEQDKVQQSLINNAVVYEDDLGLTPGTDFRLNGRIFTNANFLTGTDSANIRLYQVSSPASCFYDGENGKVTVGGNIATGGFTAASSKFTQFDLFSGKGTAPSTVSLENQQSIINSTTPNIAYNNLAYAQRINRLVKAYTTANPIATNASYTTYQNTSNDPSEVQQAIGSFNPTPAEIPTLRDEQLEIYFRKRTRRVPFNEVAFNGNALGGFATNKPYQTTNNDPDSLRPIDAWVFPTNPTDGKTETGFATLKLNTSGTQLKPQATEPSLQSVEGKEPFLGDRVRVGNNLPQLWWKTSDPKNPKFTPQFVGPELVDIQNISGIDWDDFDAEQPETKGRYRLSRVQTLADVGSTDRDRLWELDAARIPENPQDPVGGLRVVTGAGIYLRQGDTPATTVFPTAPLPTTPINSVAEDYKIWSDMMPVFDGTQSSTTLAPYDLYDSSITFTKDIPSAATPYLRMRATAVYHYNPTNYNQDYPKPIACVSSFYDPTNSTTAKNKTGLPASSNWTPPTGFGGGGTGGKSNNGIVYGPPTKSASNYLQLLTYQSNLRYRNGRSIDDGLLKKALATTATARSLSQQSTIDAAICALQILDGSITPSNTVIPHGAIFETAFLDARQIKAIHDDNTGTAALETFTNIDGGANPGTVYNLPLRDRQPLEIRATVLNMDLLRTKSIAGKSAATEYLLPNSGIIYATRDDALSDSTAPTNLTATARKLESTVDYKLDPTRRPNAIMLAKGEKLWRELDYRDAEKGLILASNLPVYVKGDFNKHTKEEFKTPLNGTWSNFYSRSDLDDDFACRKGDPRLPKCTTGDEWRSAAVVADAVTLLSNNFRLGFRNEGDYDWNNNLGDVDSISVRTFLTHEDTNNKFFQFNTYAPKIESKYDSTNGYPIDLDTTSIPINFQGSSYLNNFVTPVVREIKKSLVPDYVYEVCPKPIDQCKTFKDWVITEKVYNPDDQALANNWRNDNKAIEGQDVSKFKTGSIKTPPITGSDWETFPKRVAFKRDITGVNTGKLSTPISVYGVNSSGKIQAYEVSKIASIKPVEIGGSDTLVPWLRPDNDGNLQPILQINNPFGTPTTPNPSDNRTNNNKNSNWLQAATETTFNLIVAAGDTPTRSTEDNGGLHNYVRFLEHWSATSSTAVAAKINGIFMQLKKSAYATAPFSTSLTSDLAASNLLYATSNGPLGNTLGRLPFYHPPTRLWGYDVGLLSQSPDLFAQKLVQPVGDLPNEYFREIGKDDEWVETLLCANKLKDDSTVDGYAIDQDQRPDKCKE